MWWGTAIEAPDPGTLAAFYSRLLDWPVVHQDQGTAIIKPPQDSIYQQNPDVGLRLELGDPRAQSHGTGGGSVEIVHLDVEVHHRALLARRRRPGRRHVAL